jgi:O-antigen ligase
LAVAAAVFACIDFRYQLPSPAGFGAQFVWLESEVLRRAQGLFYEASTLGNFCAFFLLFAIVSFLAPRKFRACLRVELVLGSLVLAAALVFSYSRASLLNLLCAFATFLLIRRKVNKRILTAVVLIPIAIALIVAVAFPAFWHSYWIRLETSVLYFSTAPEAVLSGRLGNWVALGHFAANNPAHLIFGIGYKTLPYSSFIGQETIADNTYLDLLIETGLFGSLAFLAFSFEIFRTTFRAAREQTSLGGLLATFFFCFWVGESVQMLSGDLITYWRVLPIYFWVLGTALRGTAAKLHQIPSRLQPTSTQFDRDGA